jgi:hypothetical protein
MHVDIRDPSPILIHHGTAPVFGFGSGADVRLSRHFAFRGQLRDLVLVDEAGAGNRHRLLYGFGLSVKW